MTEAIERMIDEVKLAQERQDERDFEEWRQEVCIIGPANPELANHILFFMKKSWLASRRTLREKGGEK